MRKCIHYRDGYTMYPSWSADLKAQIRAGGNRVNFNRYSPSSFFVVQYSCLI